MNTLPCHAMAAALSAVVLSAAATGADRPSAPKTTDWTPEQMLRVKGVGSVHVSPAGTSVLFAVSEAVTAGRASEYRTRVYVARVGSGEPAALTPAAHSSYAPRWSPDGKVVAFLSARSGTANVWAVPAAGGEPRQLTDVSTGVTGFRWSPDGRAVAYTAPDPPSAEEERRRAEKDDAHVVDEHARLSRLFLVPSDGTRRARQLTRGDLSVTPGGFDWAPDGKAIAFSHTRTPRHRDWPTADVSLVDVDTLALSPLVKTEAAETSPLYSPDGQWVAFLESDAPPTWADCRIVRIVPAGGGPARSLARTFDENPTLVGWSAGGDRLYYLEARGTHRKLYALPLDGPPVEVGPAGGEVTSANVSRSGSWVGFAHQTLTRAPEAYVSRLDDFRPARVSEANQNLPEVGLGRTEVVRWNSPDGLTIEGLLTYPVGYDKGRRYALVLSVHGGPEGVFAQGFLGQPSTDPVAAFAAQGYAVLRCNVRGSTGYGRKFRYANYHDWGGKDFADLMAGVDHVIGLGVADPERLGVMGWSYGGYLSAWAVTQTQRFRAASVGAGFSNLTSLAGTADNIGYLPDYLGGEPWTKSDLYVERSPLFHVKAVRTATLILHGEEDRRVPISQGYELYHALKRQGVTVQMVAYPRTGHVPHEPKLLLDVMRRNVAWFDEHLQAARPR